MSFTNSEELPIEWWLAELSELIAIREGLRKRESNLRVLENAGEFITLYEAGLSVKKAYDKFWKE